MLMTWIWIWIWINFSSADPGSGPGSASNLNDPKHWSNRWLASSVPYMLNIMSTFMKSWFPACKSFIHSYQVLGSQHVIYS